MQDATAPQTRFDGPTMFFHWATAIIVVELWLGAQTIDWLPRGPLRVDARSVPVMLGAILGLLLIARIGWQATRGRRLPPADRSMLHVVAKDATIGRIIAGLAGAHAGAALVLRHVWHRYVWHRYVWHDRALARMLPGKAR